MKQLTFSAIAAAVLVAPALAGAQSPAPSPSPSPSSPQTPPSASAPATQDRAARADKVKGELVKVDAEAKKITIKGTDGVETEFAYSDATEVAAGTTVAGLATKAGTKVTVHFKSDMGTKTATKIEVDAKKSS